MAPTTFSSISLAHSPNLLLTIKSDFHIRSKLIKIPRRKQLAGYPLYTIFGTCSNLSKHQAVDFVFAVNTNQSKQIVYHHYQLELNLALTVLQCYHS